MSRPLPDKDEKPLFWVGSALQELKGFPEEVRKEIGSALSTAPFGRTASAAKPWRGEGSGVFEIVEDFDTNTYRAVYTVRFACAVYVLHAFQKKSRTGVKTDSLDVATVKRRLKEAQQHYQEYSRRKS
jgi:phage-related protein